MLPGEILEKASSRLAKLSMGKLGKFWEGSEEAFLSKVKSGEAGIAFKEREDLWSDWQLVNLRNMQNEAGGIKPGLQTIHAPAQGEMPERMFFAYNTAAGEVAGGASMYRNPEGEWIRGGLTVREQFRGKGPRGLASMLSRTLFEAGAVTPDTLSTAGAKAYYRQLKMIAQETAEAGMESSQKAAMLRDVNESVALRNMRLGDNTSTTPGTGKMIFGPRGIRRGPSGGNG